MQAGVAGTPPAKRGMWVEPDLEKGEGDAGPLPSNVSSSSSSTLVDSTSNHHHSSHSSTTSATTAPSRFLNPPLPSFISANTSHHQPPRFDSPSRADSPESDADFGFGIALNPFSSASANSAARANSLRARSAPAVHPLPQTQSSQQPYHIPNPYEVLASTPYAVPLPKPLPPPPPHSAIQQQHHVYMPPPPHAYPVHPDSDSESRDEDDDAPLPARPAGVPRGPAPQVPLSHQHNQDHDFSDDDSDDEALSGPVRNPYLPASASSPSQFSTPSSAHHDEYLQSSTSATSSSSRQVFNPLLPFLPQDEDGSSGGVDVVPERGVGSMVTGALHYGDNKYLRPVPFIDGDGTPEGSEAEEEDAEVEEPSLEAMHQVLTRPSNALHRPTDASDDEDGSEDAEPLDSYKPLVQMAAASGRTHGHSQVQAAPVPAARVHQLAPALPGYGYAQTHAPNHYGQVPAASAGYGQGHAQQYYPQTQVSQHQHQQHGMSTGPNASGSGNFAKANGTGASGGHFPGDASDSGSAGGGGAPQRSTDDRDERGGGGDNAGTRSDRDRDRDPTSANGAGNNGGSENPQESGSESGDGNGDNNDDDGGDDDAASTASAEEEEEDLVDYARGGYHPVKVGDVYGDGRYTVVRKLGWGHFSTVWLARDGRTHRLVALKIVKSAPHYTETALDEIKLLEKVVTANGNSVGRKCVVELVDWFKVRGVNGTHICMAFEVLGPNLLTLIRQYKHRGIPIATVKRVTKQVLKGLDYLHRECGIIHTDLKPENVLMCVDMGPVTARYLDPSHPSYHPVHVPSNSPVVPSHPIKHYEMPVTNMGGASAVARKTGAAKDGKVATVRAAEPMRGVVGQQPTPAAVTSVDVQLEKAQKADEDVEDGDDVEGDDGEVEESVDSASVTASPTVGPGLERKMTKNQKKKAKLKAKKKAEKAAAQAGVSISISAPVPIPGKQQDKELPPGSPMATSPTISLMDVKPPLSSSASSDVVMTPAPPHDAPPEPPTHDSDHPLRKTALGSSERIDAYARLPYKGAAGEAPGLTSPGQIAPPPGKDEDKLTRNLSGMVIAERDVEAVEEMMEGEGTPTTPATVTPASANTPSKRKRKRARLDPLHVKIADLGNACWTDHHFTNDIQTRQYRSPEAILGAKYGTSADMWSVGCMVFELITGDYLFDPQGGGRYSKDDDHIAQIIELLGHFPRHLALSGKYSNEIFNRRGELRHIHRLRFWKLSDVLTEKYRFTREEADDIANFILPMIEINPDRRATASEMVNSPWLADVPDDDEDVVMYGEGESDDAGGARKSRREADVVL
ncbi:serine/threonine protein kinase, CMGC group [Gonapodya sp. JEL0774]|nr:serine/threonine protein kinase, CMGC group [Gonapodya sp. JEL0774]